MTGLRFAVLAAVLSLLRYSVMTGAIDAAADRIACPFTATQLSEMGNATTVLLLDLFRWCAEDAECAWMYHQAERRNLTVFKHLANPQLSLPGKALYYQPLAELLCTGNTLENANRALWLQRLKANRDRAHPVCDVNHRLVLRADGINFECECRPDKTCDDGLFDLVPFYVVLALVALLALVLVVANLYEIVMTLRKLEHALPGRRGALKALERCLN